jgi:hypothetical protein
VGSRFGRVSLFVDPSGQKVGLNFQVEGVPASGDPVTVTFIIASVDPAALVNVNQTGPGTFILGENSRAFFATGGSAINAGVQLNVDVPSLETSITGSATIPPGASASVTVASTNKSFAVTNGHVSIPLS